jgi:hypothetical protein
LYKDEVSSTTNLHKQNKEVVMGFPILNTLAEIFLQIIEQKFFEAVPSFPV